MTANDMYTIAGSATGIKGETGDGGPARSALMSFAIDVSVDSLGNLYISGWAGNHLREVTATTTPTIQAAPTTTSALYPAPGGVTITQPDGSQITFYSKSGGQCTTPTSPPGSTTPWPRTSAPAARWRSPRDPGGEEPGAHLRDPGEQDRRHPDDRPRPRRTPPPPTCDSVSGTTALEYTKRFLSDLGD